MKNIIIVNLIFFYGTFVYGLEHKDIYNSIKEYFHENGIKNNFEISKKIKLPNCKEKILIKKKFNSIKTLEIKCPIQNPWKYNIRVNIKNYKKTKNKLTKIKEKKITLIKISKNLRKDQIIKEEDIYVENTNVPGSSNYFEQKSNVIGKKVKISLRKGQILRARHIEKDWTIKQGQKIIIENNKSNIQILVDGLALESAMKGDYTDVLNKSSGEKLKAWVKNSKKVSIFR